MKRSFLLCMALLTASPGAPLAWGQATATDSFVPPDSVWKKGEVLRTAANVEHIRFSADGRLAILANDRGVSIWDWPKQRESHFLSLPKGAKLACLALSADGKRLATGHVDISRVLVWDLKSGQVVRQLNHGGPVRALAFTPDNAYLASGGGHPPEEKAGQDYHVQLWKLADGKPVQRFLGPDRPIRTIAVAAGSVVAEDDRGEAFLWSRVTAKLENKITTHTFLTPLGIANGARKLIGYEVGAGRFLTAWDAVLGKKERLIDMAPTAQGGKAGFWINTDGTLAATVHPGEIIVWDLKAKAQRCTLTIAREAQVTDLAFTPDSSEVVAALNNELVLRLPIEKAR